MKLNRYDTEFQFHDKDAYIQFQPTLHHGSLQAEGSGPVLRQNSRNEIPYLVLMTKCILKTDNFSHIIQYLINFHFHKTRPVYVTAVQAHRKLPEKY